MDQELLSHLPEEKKSELNRAIKIANRLGREQVNIEMIILYGSYARGDFVAKDLIKEGNHTLSYESDFDLLLVTKQPTQEKNEQLARDLTREINKDPNIKTPVSILIEDIIHINNRIEEKRYFYMDIKKEGIILFDSGKCSLAEARELSKDEIQEMKKVDYTIWFGGGDEFLAGYQTFLEREYFNGAAFMLHQAAERFISALLLIKTSYKPKTHDLDILYKSVCDIDSSLKGRFGDNESHLFSLLKKAYVDARYNSTYSITKEEVLKLETKIHRLRDRIELLCTKEII